MLAPLNVRMIGPPHSLKATLDCWDSEAKGQASTEGFCRASALQRWRVDRATPRRLAPSRTEMPLTESSFRNGYGFSGPPETLALRSRSNWLKAARIASWSRPLADPRSRPSFSETNGMFSD